MADDAVLNLAESQHGAVSLIQIRDLGYSPDAARRFARSSNWEAVTDEVIVRRGAPPTMARALMTAVLDCGIAAVLSHQTAAHWWGLSGCALHPIQVTRESRANRFSDLTLLHTVRRLPGAWTTRLDGIPIVRPELLAMQLFATQRSERAERLVDNLWSQRLLSGGSILRFIDEHARRGRNGIGPLRRYIAERGPHYIPPATNLESWFKQLMREAGIAMRRQIDTGGDQWTGRVDFRHATLPLIVEIQSERHHTALSDRRADAARRARLVADGFVVIEITDTLLFSDPREVVARIRSAIALLLAA